MSTLSDIGVPARPPQRFPLYKTLPGFLRDPLKEIERIGRAAGGEIARLNLGPAKPYLITHPDHLQHILRDNQANYVREGMLWQPLERLFGTASILSDGAEWQASRKILQPAFTAKHIDSITGRMAQIINSAADDLAPYAAEGRPLNAIDEMYRIVSRIVVQILFGNKITQAEMDKVLPAIDDIALSLAFRMVLSFVPDAMPLPGDRAYRKGIKTIDDLIVPLVEKYHRNPGDGDDLVSLFCRAERHDGAEVTAAFIRNNLVATLSAGVETTVVALTWLWPMLHEHPDVAERLYAEIDQVVGQEPVGEAHLPRLEYARQVISELLRLYPVAWYFPRMVVEPDVVGGVPLEAGENVIITPYLTHRLESVWERPLEFDPDRFAPGRAQRRHRFAYFPFGGGPHQCMGMHLFNTEALLIIAALLSRYRPVMSDTEPAVGKVAATLRPRKDVRFVLRPRTPA